MIPHTKIGSIYLFDKIEVLGKPCEKLKAQIGESAHIDPLITF